MDERSIRDHIHRHADAVVDGDMDTVVADFAEELRPQVPEIARMLPQPVTSADVKSVEAGDDETVAEIRYEGSDGALTIRSHWQERDGAFVIVKGEPVG